MKDILKITVSLNGRAVGTLQTTPERDRCVFEYDKDWIADGFSISPLELPPRTGLIYSKENGFGGGFAAFEDSVPDGYGLYLLSGIFCLYDNPSWFIFGASIVFTEIAV